MSALYDYVQGRAPAINPEIAALNSISVDRVWRVGLVLLSHLNNVTRMAYPSESRMARMAHCDRRSVQRALRVLEESGVITQVESPRRTRAWRNNWVPSRKSEGKKLTFRMVSFYVEGIPQVSADRVFRIVFQYRRKNRTTVRHLSLRTGIPVSAVRRVVAARGLSVLSGVKYAPAGQSVRLRNASSRKWYGTSRNVTVCTSETLEPYAVGKPTDYVSLRTEVLRVGAVAPILFKAASEKLRAGRGSSSNGGKKKKMPYDMFKDSYAQDEANIPSSLIKRQRRIYQKVALAGKKEAKKQTRRNTPPEKWTTMMVAEEFILQFNLHAPMHSPQDLVPAHTLSKILSNIASENDLVTPEHMVRSVFRFFESSYFVTRAHVPAWRKFLWVVREVVVDEHQMRVRAREAAKDARAELRALGETVDTNPMPTFEEGKALQAGMQESGEYRRRRLHKLAKKVGVTLQKERDMPGYAEDLLGPDWQAIIGQWQKEVQDGLRQDGGS